MLGVVLLVSIIAYPVHAQEGRLPDQALMLVDRVIEAQQRLDQYESYVVDGTGEQTQSVAVVVGLSSQVAARSTDWEQRVTVVQVAEPNMQSDVSAQVTLRDVNVQRQEKTSTFSLDGEARLVDDRLYVRADVMQPGPDAPDLPQGWVLVDTPDALALYGDLRLRDLMTRDVPLTDRQRAIAAAENIALEQVSIDGTPADRITIEFDRDGLAMLLWPDGESIDPVMQAMIAAAGRGFRARLAVTLDAQNNPLAIETDLFVEAMSVDGGTVMPGQVPEGVMLDFSFSLHDSKTYGQVNAPVEPVPAPVQ